MIEASLLLHLSPKLANPEEVAAALSAGCERYEINTPRRIAAFLGQCAHESAGFAVMVENLRYRATRLLAMFPFTPKRSWGFLDLADAEAVVAGGQRSIANRIYGTRMGNRGAATDDGFDFRGSGFIQLTGRDAFTLYEQASGQPAVEQPDLVRAMPDAAASACWVFGAWKRCNPLADEWQIQMIGAKINGANPPYGATERLELSERALEHLTA
jgi:putative chitinase